MSRTSKKKLQAQASTSKGKWKEVVNVVEEELEYIDIDIVAAVQNKRGEEFAIMIAFLSLYNSFLLWSLEFEEKFFYFECFEKLFYFELNDLMSETCRDLEFFLFWSLELEFFLFWSYLLHISKNFNKILQHVMLKLDNRVASTVLGVWIHPWSMVTWALIQPVNPFVLQRELVGRCCKPNNAANYFELKYVMVLSTYQS